MKLFRADVERIHSGPARNGKWQTCSFREQWVEPSAKKAKLCWGLESLNGKTLEFLRTLSGLFCRIRRSGDRLRLGDVHAMKFLTAACFLSYEH